MYIEVRGNQLSFAGKTYPCAVGKNGITSHKREGDGCTPSGIFPLRECWYRADRLDAPKTQLPLKIIHETDGWCDDPKSPHYNTHITHPFSLSYERLWLEDGCYDIVVPIGYNDSPAVPGKGSAIFLHVIHDDGRPTAGCVALAKKDLLTLLAAIEPSTSIEIRK